MKRRVAIRESFISTIEKFICNLILLWWCKFSVHRRGGGVNPRITDEDGGRVFNPTISPDTEAIDSIKISKNVISRKHSSSYGPLSQLFRLIRIKS